MIDIQFQEIERWYEGMLEQKYKERLEVLKKTFCSFYNLTDQIGILYFNILNEADNMQFSEQISQSVKQEQQKALNTIINRSLMILSKMNETKGSSLDKVMFEKFSSTFETNLNILCTYYHSLNHCDIMKDKFSFEKKKIVQGINKLFALHSKIKDLYRNRHFNELKSITHQKKVITSSIKMIQQKADNLSTRYYQIQSFQKYMMEFYEGFAESQEKISENSQPLKQIMKGYLKIIRQFYETQAQLQCSILPLINFCQELKQRKKGLTSSISDAYNTFTRVSSQLLKPSYSIKTIKKLRIQDFSKSLPILFDQLHIEKNQIKEDREQGKIQNIIECAVFLVDCIREIEKVQNSGIFNTIQEYKQKINPPDSKKMINRLMQYQKCIINYYQVQQLIKHFQMSIRQMALRQFGLKVNLQVSDWLAISEIKSDNPMSDSTKSSKN